MIEDDSKHRQFILDTVKVGDFVIGDNSNFKSDILKVEGFAANKKGRIFGVHLSQKDGQKLNRYFRGIKRKATEEEISAGQLTKFVV